MKSVNLYRNADVGDQGVLQIEEAIDAKMKEEKMSKRNEYIDQMIGELEAIKSRDIMTGGGYKRKKKSKRSSRYRKSSRRKRVTQKRKASRKSKNKRSKGKT